MQLTRKHIKSVVGKDNHTPVSLKKIGKTVIVIIKNAIRL